MSRFPVVERGTTGNLLRCETRQRRDMDAFRLAESTEPAVVFSSLVWHSVSNLCDMCTVDLVEGGKSSGQARYRIARPIGTEPAGGLDRLSSRVALDPEQIVRVAFSSSHTDGGAHDDAFMGTVRFVWLRRRPSFVERALARTLVDYAGRLVASARFNDGFTCR